MQIQLWCIGKTSEKYLQQGIDIYTKRLSHYCKFKLEIIKDVKPQKSNEELKQLEAEQVMKYLLPTDYLMLLDEKGKEYSSEDFAAALGHMQLRSIKRVVFVVAGAYCAHETLINRADQKLSLSQMTFSHQMIRLFFTEQLYRAYTILRNEKYHNS